jgi:membrane-bound lytic murein transglycosylase D
MVTVRAQTGQILSKVVSFSLPFSLTFAGEAVPLQDPEIRERLEKELITLSYRHSTTVLTLKRSTRWRARVQSLLREKGVPEDFFYLAAIESDLDPYANSGKAEGFWQFRPLTAIQEGLEVDTTKNIRLRQVDQRRDVLLSTVSFCQLIRKNQQRLGSWTMAAAAYNAGLTAIQEVRTMQQTNSYYDLYLSPEPYRYVFRILAMKLIMENPRQYGFELAETDFYQPFKTRTVEVSQTVENLVDFARENGTSYRTLKFYNPWLIFRPNNYRLEVKPGRLYYLELPLN